MSADLVVRCTPIPGEMIGRGIAAAESVPKYMEKERLIVDPAWLLVTCAMLRELRPEDGAVIDHLAHVPALLGLRQTRRVGGLLRFVAPSAVRTALMTAFPTVERKPIDRYISQLARRFADCGLHLRGMVLELVPRPKPR